MTGGSFLVETAIDNESPENHCKPQAGRCARRNVSRVRSQHWIRFPTLVLAAGIALRAGAVTISLEVDLGADHGQNFGTLFEARDASGRAVMGAGFPGVYNTKFRLDHHVLQFYVRDSAEDASFTLERLPRHGPDCGTDLFDLDGTLYAYSYIHERQVKAWDPDSGTWNPEPLPSSGPLESGHGRTRLGNGILTFRDNHVDYDGRQILSAPEQGDYLNFYYGLGHLFFYHTVRGEDGFTRLYACPWIPSDDGPVNLEQAVVLPVQYTGETPFAYGQHQGNVLTCSNRGGLYRFDGTGWHVDRNSTPESFQIYSMVNYYDRLLMGHYPSGELYAYDGKLRHLSGWPPRIPGVSPRAREAQTTAIYGGQLYVGVWPWAEVWRYERGADRWHSLGRLFTRPDIHADPIHPFEAESAAAGRVENGWGQRVQGMVPLGTDLMVSSSAKGAWSRAEAPPEIGENPDGLWQEYGAVLRLNRPGNLSVPIHWKNGPFVLQFTIDRGTMRIVQDGEPLAEAEVGRTADRGALKMTWGEGVFGPLSGTILRKRNER